MLVSIGDELQKGQHYGLIIRYSHAWLLNSLCGKFLSPFPVFDSSSSHQRHSVSEIVLKADFNGFEKVLQFLSARARLSLWLSQSKKFCRISAALRHDSNGGSDFVGFLMVRNEHRRRDARLFSI